MNHVDYYDAILAEAKCNAPSAAAKICVAECVCDYYNCGYADKSSSTLPPIGNNAECPLAKYHAKHKKLINFKKALRMQPSLSDCFNLCCNCKHSELVMEQGQWVLSLEKSFTSHCLDCPVHITRESIGETQAEARIS